MPAFIWVPIALVGGLAAIWLPIMLIATLVSGWWELARAYPQGEIEPGAERGVGTVVTSALCRYKGMVGFASDAEHLHLWLPPVLGAFHAPMSIPWAQIEFPRGGERIVGLVLIRIEVGDRARKLLISPRMVRRELVVRRLIAEMDYSEER